MKLICRLMLGICLILSSCSNSNDFDDVVAKQFEECPDQNNCIINLSTSMRFEWDTMCYFSGANSLEEINKDLGFELKEFTDIGDRVVFLNKDKIVYQKEWFYNSSEPLEGVVFSVNSRKFKVSKSNAKFKIKKEGLVFYLTR